MIVALLLIGLQLLLLLIPFVDEYGDKDKDDEEAVERLLFVRE